MARATNSFPVPVSPRIKTRSRRSARPLPPAAEHGFSAALVPTISSKSCFGVDLFILDAFQPVALAQVLHKCDPAERRRASTPLWQPEPEPESHPCESTLFHKGCRRRTAGPLHAPAHRVAAYSGGVRSGQCNWPASKSSRLYPTKFEKGIVHFGNTVELPGHDPGYGRFPAIGRMRARLRRNFSFFSWRSLKSRTTLAKPCNRPS